MNEKRIAQILSRPSLDTDRKRKNAIKKAEAEEKAEREQKPVSEITLAITWKKSKTWGSNPKLEATVNHIDGYSKADFTCSGCGYDKESTVIAQAFNQLLKYRLWELEGTDKEVPYGVRLPSEYGPRFEGGIGTSCYYAIAEFIGAKFEKIASGKEFDVYKLTMNK